MFHGYKAELFIQRPAHCGRFQRDGRHPAPVRILHQPGQDAGRNALPPVLRCGVQIYKVGFPTGGVMDGGHDLKIAHGAGACQRFTVPKEIRRVGVLGKGLLVIGQCLALHLRQRSIFRQLIGCPQHPAAHRYQQFQLCQRGFLFGKVQQLCSSQLCRAASWVSVWNQCSPPSRMVRCAPVCCRNRSMAMCPARGSVSA